MYLKPKKSLGQNFLIDKNIRDKIINACEFKNSDTVLEIGPGRGELTGSIAPRVSRVYAVEIDLSLSSLLKADFKGVTNVEIINRDILKYDIKRRLRQSPGESKIIGNIPYYITTPIIEKVISLKTMVRTVFLTVQKEFARRIAAQAGEDDYGSFSCFVQYHARPRILFTIKRTCFRPVPRVDSCFLKLEIKETPDDKVNSEKKLFRIIRAAFNQRRKTLRNSLEGVLAPDKLKVFFKHYGIDVNARPETLTLKDFINLTNL